ncbi:MAG: AI-2E family transporter [Chloroflexi bacterium]|nr:AI-2E family transporter [Chloroflexota bacterium]
MAGRSLLPEADHRWLHALLVMGTFVVGFFLLGQVAGIVLYFSDILFILVMAWMVAFVLSPVVSFILRTFPTLPRGLVTVLVYVVLFVALTALIVVIAGNLVASVAGFVSELPNLNARLPEILRPWEERLAGLGLQVDLVSLAQSTLAGVGSLGTDLVRPLTALAIASLGAIGNLLLIVFLSLFILIDKDGMVAFVNRLVPPRWADEARLFETSVASSFGGFLRGQAIQGVIYAVFAVVTHLVLGLDFTAASAGLVFLLQALPFFGAFVSWAPPVVVAALTQPEALIPALVIMGIGWFIVMNIVQPRVMASAVGIHPVVVLLSVLIGLKLYGVVGAIFAVPVAAVISAFFFHFLDRSAGGPRDVTSRAVRRVEEREGRRIRVPEAPGISASSPAPLPGPARRSLFRRPSTSRPSTEPAPQEAAPAADQTPAINEPAPDPAP